MTESLTPTDPRSPPSGGSASGFNEEITSVDVGPLKAGPKKIKIALGILGLFFILASIPTAVYLANQRQELRKMARPGSQAAITCEANTNGVFVTNNTDSAQTVVIEWLATYCDKNPSCVCGAGTLTNEPTLQPGQTVQYSFVNQRPVCGEWAWQTDVKAKIKGAGSWACSDSANGCGSEPCPTPTPQPTPTPLPIPTPTSLPTPTPTVRPTSTPTLPPTSTPRATSTPTLTSTPTATPHPTVTPSPPATPTPEYTLQCSYCRAYNTNWQQISNPSTIQVGQTVYFATAGTTNHPLLITKARFRINNGASSSWCTGSGNSLINNWCETTNYRDVGFYVRYTIPSSGDYTVDSMVFNPDLGWR